MELPLFPLRSVLFPGQELPLRVFEDRYRQMTRELLNADRRFGVLLIREGSEVGGGAVPFDVGTIAEITEWEELANGQYILTTRGTQRFRLRDWLPPRPYPYGEIELLDDEAVDHDSVLLKKSLETVRTTFPVYFRLALSLSGQWAKGLRLPRDPHELVNFVAPWLQVEEEVKQRLLEVEGAPERVAYLAEVVDDLLIRTREQAADHRRQKFAGLGAAN
ncbi:MAG: LON peptidase substrate-binding domain-containing protein [Tepidiformaceae bacterium]